MNVLDLVVFIAGGAVIAIVLVGFFISLWRPTPRTDSPNKIDFSATNPGGFPPGGGHSTD